MDGSDGMYAVKLTSFGVLEFVANENTLGNEYVRNNLINLVNIDRTRRICIASNKHKDYAKKYF